MLNGPTLARAAQTMLLAALPAVVPAGTGTGAPARTPTARLIQAPPTDRRAESTAALALVGGRIHPAPDAVPIDDGVVVIERGHIAAVGPRSTTTVPAGIETIDCTGLVVVAGFQNSHVHFTDPGWLDASGQDAPALSLALEEMLTRHGFTTVVDIASYLENTLALRRRIETGEIRGPRILTAGFALYPMNAVPFYVRRDLSAGLLARLPQPATAAAATALVERQIAAGADVVKLFAGSLVEPGQVVPMQVDVATAATVAAHRHGKVVFAHPTSGAGLEIALRAGVDVLAHPVEDTREVAPEQWQRMLAQRVAMVPTLALFDGRFAWDVVDEVGDYARAGGDILFGTDVGFLSEFDPSAEYDFLSAAGLGWRAILASLTTNPARRFGEDTERGRIGPGLAADLVVLGHDPVTGSRAFADVRATIRGGTILYQSPSGAAQPGRRAQ